VAVLWASDEGLLAAVDENLETGQAAERGTLFFGELPNGEDVIGADANAVFHPLAAVPVDDRHDAAGFFAVGGGGHG